MREMEQSDPSGMYIYERDGTVRPIRGVHNIVMYERWNSQAY